MPGYFQLKRQYHIAIINNINVSSGGLFYSHLIFAELRKNVNKLQIISLLLGQPRDILTANSWLILPP